MTLEQIKQAVSRGDTVHWHNSLYQVIEDKTGQYLITCKRGSTIGLTRRDGITLNGAENEFYLGYK